LGGTVYPPRTLVARERQQTALAALGLRALSGIEFDELLASVVEIIGDVIAAPFCKIFEVISPDRRELLLVAGYGWREGSVGKLIFRRPESPDGSYTLELGKPAVVQDWALENREKPDFLKDHQIVSSVSVPIVGVESHYGFLGVDSDVPRHFSEDEIGFLQSVANIVGIAVQRRHHERQRRQSERLIMAILDSSPVAIIAVDRRGDVVTWNRAAESIFGYTTEEVMGRPYPLVPASGMEEHRRLFRKLREGTPVRDVAVERRHKDGRTIRALKSAEPLLDEEGKFAGATCTLTDITDRRRIEEQLRHAQRMDAIGNLTGGIAHDFNNILSIIIGNLDLLTASLAGPDERDLAETALQGALRGSELTRQLLAFSRRQELTPRITDVNTLLHSMVKLLERTLGETIDIRLSLGIDLWPVEIDPAQLDSAIMNLALNARDAMDAGGTLTLSTRNAVAEEISWDGKADVRAADYVVLEVTDDGAGIPPELVNRIFEPFFTSKAPGKGTGLGLSMVYGFVKQSGGHISVYSEVGQGTTFRLYLPRSTSASSQGQLAPTRSAPVLRGKGERVLVVEDNPAVRQVAIRQFSTLGYEVAEVASAPEALRMLERDRNFDLVFSDMVMPGGMSGHELAMAIAARWPAIRVLLTSGYPEMVVRERRDISPNLLSKPYRQADLARRVREILDA